jgi:lactoylglutathione lyase
MPRLNLLVLRVADLERAAAFYRRLGFTFVEHAHGAGPTHLAAEEDGLVFELYPATPAQPPSMSTRIGFSVDDVDAAVAELAGLAGVQILSAAKESEWGRRAVVADPDGHRVELVAARPGT